MRYCSNCGKELGEEAKFCPNCGASPKGATKIPASMVQPAPVPAPRKQDHHKLALLIVVAIAAALIIFTIGASVLSRQGASGTDGTDGANNTNNSLPRISGVNVTIDNQPTYKASMGYMVMTINITNGRSVPLEIYNDTYVATLKDGTKIDGFFEGNPSIKIAPGAWHTFIIKFYTDGWVDIASLRFADESGYLDIPIG